MTEADKEVNLLHFGNGYQDLDQPEIGFRIPDHFWLRQPKSKGEMHLALAEVCALVVLSSFFKFLISFSRLICPSSVFRLLLLLCVETLDIDVSQFDFNTDGTKEIVGQRAREMHSRRDCDSDHAECQ